MSDFREAWKLGGKILSGKYNPQSTPTARTSRDIPEGYESKPTESVQVSPNTSYMQLAQMMAQNQSPQGYFTDAQRNTALSRMGMPMQGLNAPQTPAQAPQQTPVQAPVQAPNQDQIIAQKLAQLNMAANQLSLMTPRTEEYVSMLNQMTGMRNELNGIAPNAEQMRVRRSPIYDQVFGALPTPTPPAPQNLPSVRQRGIAAFQGLNG